ncbi:unnamed protein product, partial [Linum tenue]
GFSLNRRFWWDSVDLGSAKRQDSVWGLGKKSSEVDGKGREVLNRRTKGKVCVVWRRR